MKRRHKHLPFKLVKVEWEDSARPTSAWGWIDDYERLEAVECISVGFLIAQTDRALAIAANIGDVTRDRIQASGIIQIPTCSVRRLVEL
jgi:hypothetical protein